MGMRLTSDCHVRTYAGDSLFWSLRRGCGLLVSNAELFIGLLRASGGVESEIERLAVLFEVPPSEIRHDFHAFCYELARAGMVEHGIGIGDTLPFVSAGRTTGTKEEGKGGHDHDLKASLPIAQFYGRHGLLSDLHIDLTDACTEQCVHCYVPQGQHDFLSYGITEKVLREFREQQGLTVQLTGGECMLHPDFEKICRLCRALDLNFVVMSNLTLCDENTVALLKETNPQFVNVSLYSMDEAEHDAITQIPGSWRKTRAAIDRLQEEGVAVRLATPLLKLNQTAYPALKAFAKMRHVHLVPDCDIIPRCGGDCSNLNYTCSPEEVERVLSEDKAFWNRGYGDVQNFKPEDRVCDIGNLLSLNSKGLYYPCSGMQGYVLGDAGGVSLSEVWKGEKMVYLRNLRNKDFTACVACTHRPYCKVCPAFNFNATGCLFDTLPEKCALAAVKHRVYGEP